MLLIILLLVSIAFIIYATARLQLQPFLALLITAFAFGILSGMPLGDVVKSVNDGFGGTIGSIGIVILAGAIIGTFAAVVGETLADTQLGILLPFLITAGIKTAQGSSTVAIITTAGLMTPLLDSLGLGSDTAKALVVVAIGGGSMVVSHANDSFFWVVTQFSNMDAPTGYKLQTVGTLVQGVVADAAVWVASVVAL